MIVENINTKTLIELFQEQVIKTPDKIAIVCRNNQLTFNELNKLTNQLGDYIRQKYDVSKNDLIGIKLAKSEWMVISVLGILKSGAAFVPIDIEYPKKRIDYIMKDCNFKALIDEEELNYFESIRSRFKENNLDKINNGEDLAYCIYTSGSTGEPKGVLIKNISIINYITNCIQDYISINSLQTGSYMYMSLSFDASLTALFAPLLSGKLLVISSLNSNLEVFNDANFLKFAPYDFIKLTPSQLSLLETFSEKDLKNITNKYVLGGETLHYRHYSFLSNYNIQANIVNEYGPTETTVGCISYEFKILNKQDVSSNGILIGHAMPNVEVFILNNDMEKVPNGEIGEIYIGGIQLAKSYLNKQDIYDAKFIKNPFSKSSNDLLYKSGDLATYTETGDIQYLGREDNQVKIAGNRIELGEIEFALNKLIDIEQAVVTVTEDTANNKRLIAYLQSQSKNLNTSDLIKELKKSLPAFMIPSAFYVLPKLPMNVNGKIDIKDLNYSEISRSKLNSLYKKANTLTEIEIASVWQDILKTEPIGIEDNFFELGGNSMLLLKMVSVIKNKYNYLVPVTKVFQHPSIKEIAKFIDNQENQNILTETYLDYNTFKTRKEQKEIAVIGMAGRFPGANSVEELWEVLKKGEETTRFFSMAELDTSIPSSVKNDPDYVAARGVLDEVDKFDASFFGLNPKLAELMDPQQRLFLEISWELLEQSGYSKADYNGKIGVYAGSNSNTYFINNVISNSNLIEQIGNFQVMTVNDNYVAARTAYELNLKGPAVSVFSGCSTSLLAIAQAVESLRKGQCDLAIAGGVSITSPVNSGHLYQEGAILSKDGHCRPFDADATGTVFSDGAGVVLLKNLEDAINDGDFIYSVIKGIGINNDGGGKGSFTAPSAEGQAEAIRMAIDDANIESLSISYIEAHGTGTPIGDPIEMEGLKIAFGIQTALQFCAIGSIKSNMGHLTTAAGVAGLIKTSLALNHKQIPASIGYVKKNPHIDFESSPFFVNDKLTHWSETNSPRRAGVSSFGVGGTNVHVILEEFENQESFSDNGLPMQLITWSAKSKSSLENYAIKLSDYIRINNNVKLADVAYTLQLYRSDFNNRRFIVASSPADFLNQLLVENVTGSDTLTLKESAGEIVFSFPGQGAQYLNMGKELYKNEPVFQNAIDECSEILQGFLNLDIREIIYPKESNHQAEEQLKNTKFTQPALFITEYALSKLWVSWGIEPSILCGHSIGEFVAAHLAGIFNLEDALELIAKRGNMVSCLPKGSMLSVRLEVDKLKVLIPETLSIAAINSKKICVVAGTDELIAMFSKELDRLEIPNKILVTSHAFHSSMMDPIIVKFREVVSNIKLNKPKMRLLSTVSGTWIKDEEATDPQYWADHLRKTVRFSDALDVIATLDKPIFIEVGPGNVTSALAKQQVTDKKMNIVFSLERNDSKSEYYTMFKALGQIWINGVTPKWSALYRNQKRTQLKLPTYAFDKKQCWVDPVNRSENYIKNEIAVTSNFETLIPTQKTQIQNIQPMRKETLFIKIKQLLEDASGIEMRTITKNMNFFEIGLDSLLLTQVAITFKKVFGLPITFRQLNDKYSTPELLIDYLDLNLPATAFQEGREEIMNLENINVDNNLNINRMQSSNNTIDIISQQIQMLSNQVALLQNKALNSGIPIPVNNVKLNDNGIGDLSREEAEEIKKPFGATARIEKQKTALSQSQSAFLKALTERYNKKTSASKSYAQKYRGMMADPRVVSGFKPLTKEIVYPIVVNKSKGSKLWDIDGNEYIDALNGFGSCMFGYQPEFIKKVMHEQIENGYEVGPQHELAGEVCSLICELTGHDRTALCSTGSEAVLGSMRIARTVTGRSLIVAFNGSYHGIVDEVIVRGTKKLKSFPAAPGIMPEAVQNMLILDYGTEESLRIIKERANELAAVLVEPVQSRRPEFVPVDFLKELRKITLESGTALIFDEVITGFRMHPGGAQALFGIKADIASYGKVVGAGIPIGVIAGKKEFMDALDGGFWQYGDESFPEIGVTYFAGTFVRHPLALASAKAALCYMKDKGPDLQLNLNKKTNYLANMLNTEFMKLNVPIFVAHYGSLWKLKYKEEMPYSELLFTLMREKGIHIWDGFPCFMTEAHNDEEVNLIIRICIESTNEMINAGFFKMIEKNTEPSNKNLIAPVEGARLGRDPDGNPAWFIADSQNPGIYIQLNVS